MLRFLIVGLLVLQAFSQCSENCDACNLQIQGCLYCKPGFTRNFINACQQQKVQKCQLLDLSGNCFLCFQLYDLKQQKCVKSYDGCGVYDGPEKCGECLFGTRLIDNKCEGVLNCDIYQTQEVCQTCYPGYLLQDNICKDFSAGCLKTHEQSGACESCREGYTMSGYMCVENSKLIKYCQFYEPADLQRNCFRCLTGFEYHKEKRECRMISFGTLPQQSGENNNNNNNFGDGSFQGTGGSGTTNNNGDGSFQGTGGSSTNNNDDGSFEGTGGSSSSNFNQGFGNEGSFEGSGSFESNGNQGGESNQNQGGTSSETSITGDDLSFGGTGGDTCPSGQIKIPDGRCILIPPGCAAVNFDTGECQVCHPYFKKSDQNVCVDLKCFRYNPNTGFCEECVPGFFKDEVIGACIDKQCDNIIDGECVKCTNGYYLPKDEIICRKNLQNCLTMNSELRICSVCQFGYDLMDGFCSKPTQKIPGCISQENNICLTCETSRLQSNGICINLFCAVANQQPCSQCLSGYEKNNNGVCIDPFCLLYDKHICINCVENYAIDPTGKCVLLPEFCFEIGLNGLCAKCLSGYQISENVCQKKQEIKNCIKADVSNPSECIICQERYYTSVDRRSCMKVPDLCKDYNPQTGFCFSCNFNLIPQDGKCIDLNCLSFNADGKCTACKNLYEANPQTEICENRDPFCIQVFNNKCQNCAEGYYLDGENYCKQLPFGCKVAHFITGICLECHPEYSISQGKCSERVQIENCEQANPSNLLQCLICKQRYYTFQNGCAKVSDKCQGYNPLNGFCISCIEGYSIDRDAGKCMDPNCEQYDGDICTKCKNFFSLLNSNLPCFYTDQNCKLLGNNRCNECHDGYYLHFDGYCGLNPVFCVEVDSFGVCRKCQDNYDFENGVCVFQEIQIPDCFQVRQGVCVSCNAGFQIFNGGCERPIVIPNCAQINQRICQVCFNGFHLWSGQCYVQIPQCLVYNSATTCRDCSNGYELINGRCSQEIIPVQIPNCVEVRDNQCARCENGYEVRGGLCFIVQPDKILNCLNQQEFFCLECIERYYLSDNQCMQIGNGCNTYNKFTGICDTCYPGYEPNSGKCLIAQIDNKANHDPNCLQTQGDICQKCSNRYYYNGDKCVPVNPLCRDYNNITGACTTCYPSYQVSDSKCILAPSGDPNCKVNQNGVCLECYQSFYPSNGKCVRVNVLCKTFNKFDGRCETCYKGYRVSNGNCVIHFQDPNCKEFDANENCIQCVNKHYVSGNKCVPVNPNCKEHNQLSGACTECYTGYKVQGRDCVLGTDAIDQPNCKVVAGDFCQECYPRFYIKNGKCEQVNPFCRGYNQFNGDCTQCYVGFILENGKCVLPEEQDVDGNCKTFVDTAQRVCRECYPGYYPQNGLCIRRDDNCANFSLVTFICQGCYSGYGLNSQNRCVIFDELIGDPNCIQVQNQICSKCADGYFRNQEGKCELADPQCKTYDFGICMQCYLGYNLREGKCESPFSSSNNIPNCEIFDVIGQCSKCVDRYYVKDRGCHHVSILCGQYNMFTGECLTCNSEYFNLQNGECIQLNSVVEGCQRYEGPFCAECQAGYYFSIYNCFPIDANCVQFDYATTMCKRCRAPLTAQGTACI